MVCASENWGNHLWQGGAAYSVVDGPRGTMYSATDSPGGPVILPRMIQGSLVPRPTGGEGLAKWLT